VYVEFEDNKKYPKKGAARSDSHTGFHSCGRVIKEDDVVIDIDELPKEAIQKAIQIFNIKTETVWTDRGAHFWYKKPRNFRSKEKICPLGIKVEYKHSGNTEAVTIKRDGKLRLIENEGVREELPDFFFINRRLESLQGMDEGEGRNKALFAHRMKIHHLKSWKPILRFINNHVFAEPLDEDEFGVIARDGVSLEATKNNQNEIADQLLSKYNMVMFSGKLYFQNDDQEYVSDDDLLRRIVFEIGNVKKTGFVDEVIKQLKYKAFIVPAEKVFDVKLKNGILREGHFIKVTYQEFTPFSIDIEYNPKADPVPIVDEYLDHLTDGDPDYKARLLEALAHTLIVDKDFKRLLAKFFIFVGGGGNGKGTLLRIISEILGKKNCSALSIKQMADERYFTTMQGKLCNLGDDLEDEYINKDQMKLLKNISTCDFVSARNLFEQSRDVELTLSLIFTSNHILKSKEKGDSYKRRVDWMPMYSKPTKRDPDFIRKLTTDQAKQYWIRLIVEAYQRLYRVRDFTPSEAVANFNEEYHRINNNVLDFLEGRPVEEWITNDKNRTGKTKNEAFKMYKAWCEENEEFNMGKEKFHEILCNNYEIEYGKVNIYKQNGDRTSTMSYFKK
jgi:putative DNA primase/helicase